MALKLRTWTTGRGDRIQVACCCDHSRRVKEGGPETASKESRNTSDVHLQHSSLREAALMAGVSKSTLHKRAEKKGGGVILQNSVRYRIQVR